MTVALILLLGLLFVGSVGSTKLSSRFNMPSLLVFLAVGMFFRWLSDLDLLKDDVVLSQLRNIISWGNANLIGSLALALILFSGGYCTKMSSIKKVWKTGIILSSFGVLVTAIIMAFCGLFILRIFLPFKVTFSMALLLGSIISSTDAAAVFSILRSKSVGLKGDLQDLLECESGSNDPMATFMTVFMLEIVILESIGALNQNSYVTNYLLILPYFILRMSVGLGMGVMFSVLTKKMFNILNLEHDGLYYVLGIGAVMVTFGVAELCYGNGFMAVYTLGIMLGNSRFVFHNGFGRFSEAVSWLMQVILFALLGFQATPSLLVDNMAPGLLMGICLMFLARPLGCFLCMICSKFSLKERVLVSWVGLRGGAPIMLATYPMLRKMEVIVAGPDGLQAIQTNEIMFHIVFFMVLLSVIFQGMTIMPVARLLKLDAPCQDAPPPPLRFENTGLANATVQAAGNGEKEANNGEMHNVDFSGASTAEFTVGNGSDFAGKTLASAGLPVGAFVIMVRRGRSYIMPRGNTELYVGDCLTVLGHQDVLEECRIRFKTSS